jgi:hypothetical protein
MEAKEAGGFRRIGDNSLPQIEKLGEFVIPKGFKLVLDEDAEVDLNKIEEFLNAHMDKQVADVKLRNLREDTAIEELLERGKKEHKERQAERKAKIKAWKANNPDSDLQVPEE